MMDKNPEMKEKNMQIPLCRKMIGRKPKMNAKDSSKKSSQNDESDRGRKC